VTAAAAAASSKARGDQLVLAKEVKRLREELAAAKHVSQAENEHTMQNAAQRQENKRGTEMLRT
jgi:hypothetical protein